MRISYFLASVLLAASTFAASAPGNKPNIVFIFTDDQDYHHDSLEYMESLQKHLVAKGTLFTNHYATIAVCCPSRVSLMRGQAAHNTNNTQVAAPGGGYPKFVAAGEDSNYLPHWLVRAGYRAEYIGKLYNGNSLLNYSPAPKGWSHIDVLVSVVVITAHINDELTMMELDPYINVHNSVVMSQNGETPVYYEGWQQTDVLRVKALARLEELTAKEDPFFLMIAPTAPHVENATDPPTPPSRYLDKYSNLTLRYRPNFNPPDELHQKRPSWWAGLPRLNSTQLDEVQKLHQRRQEALEGVDDIIEDTIRALEQAGKLENTYIIYSTDQGYHLGSHRDVGKCSPYIEDANIPLIVRGPGISEGQVSHLPSTVTDFAPTFLDIAGLAIGDRPPFLDGTSMLEAWEDPLNVTIGRQKEAINVEFWGRAFSEIPTWTGGDSYPGVYRNNTYKTMRIVSDSYAYVYSSWCTGDIELYDSVHDPYELSNIADSTDVNYQRVKSRLNALLMVTKSCETDICRDPWSVIQPPNAAPKKISSLGDALDPAYDDFFSTFPRVTIAECVQYQFAPNEVPFYPPEAQSGLGLAFRNEPQYYEYPDVKPIEKVPYIAGGSWEQRHATFDMLVAAGRVLSANELQQAWNQTTCSEGQVCQEQWP
ncbi:hypothetical protein PFICI_15110 [Pestalotiopsis fici W106-1]|uniref:Sulfatase N-terminal domain-containing protein n=1 Tax=Pestalotiopsis fici (strain W106-1 / CGMCC3.15140) TaxID=1229662 RepID=W3WGW7_PESFW|nr:uncharacterized protein PFICI_15110 [Pestalotiopsis fici W106-1]ETS73165.1 hypothetical protein PFICI_15110 [Pestalotiopsis fici W106-1]